MLEARIGGASGARGPLVFISYAREEKQWLEQFRVYLKQYEAAGEFERWDDDYIKVGDQWRREIDAALARACVGVLLASARFLASDFIRGTELPALLAAAAKGTLRLVCVPVSAGDFAYAGLTDVYQWSRPPNQPLDRLRKARLGEELVRIAREVRAAALASPVAERSWTPPPQTYLPVVTTAERARRQPASLYDVPTLPQHFVSRPEPARAINLALLSGTSNVAIVGVGGSGKSLLAAEAVRDLELRSSFPDGIYWLTLGETPSLTTLLQQFLGRFGPATLPSDLPQLRERLRAALADRSCLLVLDDLWRASDAFAFDVLGPHCRMLVTTRNRGLPDGIHARAITLDTVSNDEALELMAKRSHVAPSDLPAAARQLAAGTGGLPLPLALLAAQVGPTRSWDTVLAAFNRALSAHRGDPTGNVFAAMRVCIDFLDVQARERLFDLAIFPEDVDVPTAIIMAVWEPTGLSAESASRLIESFIEHGFVHRSGPGTIRLHDLQRDYLNLRVENLADTHGRLIDSALPTLTSGWAALPADNRYLWKHLAYHLAGAGRSDELERVLLDPAWTSERIRLDGVSSLIADFEYVAAVPGMVEIQTAIRQSAHVFATDIRQVPSQLAGRIPSRDVRAIQRLHKGLAAFHQWPWLRPLSASLAPPPGLQRTFEVEPDASTLAFGGGDRLFAGTRDGQIRAWDVSSGAEFRPIAGGLGYVHSVRVTGSGQHLLSASETGGLQLWNLESGNLLAQGHVDGKVARAEPISDDGRRAVIEVSSSDSQSDGNDIRLFEFDSGAAGWSQGGCHRLVAATRAGVILASFGDTEVRQIDAESGNVLASVLLPAAATALAIRSDAGMCASGDEKGRLHVWDRGGAPVQLGKEQDAIRAMTFGSTADALFVTHGILPRFVLWNIPARQRRLAFPAHGWAVQALIAGAGAREYVSAADKTIKIWKLDSATEQRSDPVHHLPVPAKAFSRDGRVFATGGNDGRVAVWNGESGDLLERVLDEGPIVAEVWVSADAARIAWRDESHGCMVRTLGTHPDVQLRLDDVTKASFAADVDWAAIVRVDGQLSFWNLDTGMSGVPDTQPEIVDVQVTPSGRWALSSHRNGMVRLWETDSRRVVREEVNVGCAQIAFWTSPDGDVAGWLWPSGAARSCRLPAMAISDHAWPEQAQLTADPSIVFHRDHQTTVVIHGESSTQVRTDQPPGPVAAVPGRRRLVATTPSFSRVLTIWDAGTGEVVARFTAGEGEIDSACWSPDGRVVVVAERVGTLHFLRLEGM